jgi:hypothetical protein
MADEERYRYGDLNPISKPRARRSLDPRGGALRAMREAAIDTYTPDSIAGTGPYKGIVLRKEPDDKESLTPGGWLWLLRKKWKSPQVFKRYKIRIPELHAMLPEPSGNNDHGIIDMYPTFIAQDSDVPDAAPGEIVWVNFGSVENMEDPTYLGPVASGTMIDGDGDNGNSWKPTQKAKDFFDKRKENKFEGNTKMVGTDWDKRLAELVGIEVGVLMAIREVESGGDVFAIRFEPHLFLKTRGDLSGVIPCGSCPKVSYVKSETDFGAYKRAWSHDSRLSIESSSWGAFQVMGSNLYKVDFSVLEDYGLEPPSSVKELCDPDSGQFFSNSEMATKVSELLLVEWFNGWSAAKKDANNHEWSKLARKYNGPSYADHDYDIKLEAAYNRIMGE